MEQIKITPEELRDAAKALDGYLDDMNEKVKLIKNKIDEVTNNWEGASQSSFLENFEDELYPILSKTLPDVVNGISEQLNGAADAIEQTDEEVAKAYKS